MDMNLNLTDSLSFARSCDLLIGMELRLITILLVFLMLLCYSIFQVRKHLTTPVHVQVTNVPGIHWTPRAEFLRGPIFPSNWDRKNSSSTSSSNTSPNPILGSGAGVRHPLLGNGPPNFVGWGPEPGHNGPFNWKWSQPSLMNKGFPPTSPPTRRANSPTSPKQSHSQKGKGRKADRLRGFGGKTEEEKSF